MERLCNVIADFVPFAVYWNIGVAILGFICVIALFCFGFSRVNKRRKENRMRFGRR